MWEREGGGMGGMSGARERAGVAEGEDWCDVRVP